MNERITTVFYHSPGTLSADETFVVEFPFPVTLLGVKATASNDSDATLAVSGGATIAAAAIGDSSDPEYLEPTSPDPVDKDTAITFTLDYDGAGGTAADDVSITAFFLVGEG